MYDYCIVGGGIVGLATAADVLLRRPGAGVVVLEKESQLATHQTGHNSGVIHSGIYYEPRSLKASFCRAGSRATKALAAEHGIPVQKCGKLLVATSSRESWLMAALERRASANQIPVERLDARELGRREPAICGLGALYVESTGIIDYTEVAQALADRIRRAGGVIETGATVIGFEETTDAVHIATPSKSWTARRIAVCAGLQADRLARLAGLRTDFQVVPFRGEYFRLPAVRNDIIRHLIYPIPDPDLPFLGIHLTRTPDGGVTVGPNAVLGMAREGYSRGSFDARDVREMLGFAGTWRLAMGHWALGMRELRNSIFRRAYLTQCRKYCPDLTIEDLTPAPAGIRAQVVMGDGALRHDFLFLETDRSLHVCNAPSPAATSAVPIARYIADRLLREGA